MADNSIDLVVSQKAFTQLKELLDEIKKADDAITALNVNAAKNPTTPSGGEANAAENAKIIAQMKELTAEINKQAEAANKLVAARTKNTNAINQDIINARIERANETERLKLNSEKLNAYQKLEAAQKKAANSAKLEAAGLVQLANANETATERAKRLGNELQRIDASVGKYNRNVGNYASGWNGLANSVNQLTREAPAFANSLNTGFMALSNNIPILADELIRLNQANKDLIKNGKPTESIFKTLAGALFSWQTALSVGVTLLTIYGKDLVEYASKLFSTEKSLSSVKLAQDDLNKAFEDSSLKDAVKNVSELTINIDLAKKGFLDKDDVVRQYNDTIGKTTGFVTSLDEAEKELTKNGDNYVKMMLYKAAANLALEASAAEALKAEQNRLKKTEEFTDKFLDADLTQTRSKEQYDAKQKNLETQRKKRQQEEIRLNEEASKKQLDIAKTFQERAAKIANSSNFNLLGGNKPGKEEDANVLAYEAKKAVAQKEIQLNEEKLNNEELFINERLALLDKDKQLRYSLASIDYNEQVRLAKGNHDKLIKAESDFIKNKSQINEEYNKKQTNLIKSQLTAIEKLAKSINESDPNKMLAESTKKATKELEKMAAQQQKNIEITEASKQAMKDFAVSFAEDFAGQSGFGAVSKLFEGDDSLFKRMQNGSAFTKDSWAADTNSMMEAGQEMYNFISNASQANFDAEYARLESQKEVALKFAGDSESARAKVEEDAEKRRKEIAAREFKAKKTQSMVNIAIDTAQAIIGAIAKSPLTLGMPWAAILAGMGAAQLAVVASQKMPNYAEGTDNHPGGLALINDGKGSNYKETVVTPDGKVRQFSGRDVIIDAPAGTQVFTHDQWNNELNTMMREKGVSMSNSFNSRSGLSYAEMDSIIAKHFSKITTQSTVIDRNGFNTFVSNGSSKTIRNQSRYSGTGFSV